MWLFLNQYGWYLLIFGMMILMHRKGMGGCCGGQHGDPHHDQENHKDHPVTKKSINFEENSSS